MSRWFRFYDDALNDPKVQKLPAELFKAWVNLLCLASKNGGQILSLADASFALRLPEVKAGAIVADLAGRGLFDQIDGGYFAPHNWGGRQFKSDVSNERVQRYRKRKRNVTDTVTETPPEQNRAETEQKEGSSSENVTRETFPAPSLVDSPSLPEKYAFDGGIIRLTQKGFADWVAAYPAIDLRGELTARDAWLGSDRATDADRKSWYVSTSKYLANRNMEAKNKVAALRPGSRETADFNDPEWRHQHRLDGII